jgi:hypothetical protein
MRFDIFLSFDVPKSLVLPELLHFERYAPLAFVYPGAFSSHKYEGS